MAPAEYSLRGLLAIPVLRKVLVRDAVPCILPFFMNFPWATCKPNELIYTPIHMMLKPLSIWPCKTCCTL